VAGKDPPGVVYDTGVSAPTFIESSPQAVNAMALASERHRGQRRKADGADFLVHPLEVAALLHAVGASQDAVAAGVLHDVLEKSETEPWEIEACCGARVRELVEAVTEDRSIAQRGARKAELRRRAVGAGGEAAMIFAADKISKVREWRLRMACGEEPPEQTVFHYHESLDAVAGSIPKHPLAGLLRFELEALASFPPGKTERPVTRRLAADAR
jgi:guanosine-3',5'-bis(diphosphate) 3'-pyrophosphohydrolase